MLQLTFTCQGRISDGGVFKSTELNEQMKRNSLNFPTAQPLNSREKVVPYLFIDFCLEQNLMKPFSYLPAKGTYQRIYNYRHCRKYFWNLICKFSSAAETFAFRT